MPKISRRTLIQAAGSLAALSALPTRVLAAYPERAVKLIVPFAPGGNADIVGRLVAEGMSQALGQPVIVENRGGAGGGVGAGEVARAAPDGYTLLSGSNGPLTVNPLLHSNLPYDPLKDFVPVGLTSLAPHALVVNAALPAKTLAELIALSKKQQIGVGTSGIGSATHLTLERFNAQSGAKLLHVPYKSGGALLPDLIAGTIQGAMTEFSSALPHHRSGKARFVAIASAKRLPQVPDVPTIAESFAGFTAASYIGVLAPAGTPAEALARLEKALAAAMKSPKTLARMGELGIEPAAPDLMSSSGFGYFIRQEYERSREAVRLAGIKPD
jgi:tripartite-type tricarboxylate transporter receptor subunit TctC